MTSVGISAPGDDQIPVVLATSIVTRNHLHPRHLPLSSKQSPIERVIGAEGQNLVGLRDPKPQHDLHQVRKTVGVLNLRQPQHRIHRLVHIRRLRLATVHVGHPPAVLPP